jgi:hypothetical protein
VYLTPSGGAPFVVSRKDAKAQRKEKGREWKGRRKREKNAGWHRQSFGVDVAIDEP